MMRRLFIIAGCCLLFSIAIGIGILFFPSIGSVQELSAAEVADRLSEWGENSPRTQFLQGLRVDKEILSGDSSNTQEAFQHGNFSFKYPLGLYQKRQENKKSDEETSVKFIRLGNGYVIRLVASRTPWKEKFDEFPAIRTRRQQLSLYREELIQNGDKTGHQFTRTDAGWERIAFWVDNGTIVSLAISTLADSASEIAEKDYTAITQTVEFE